MSREDAGMRCIPVTEADIDRARRLLEMADGFTATIDAMDLVHKKLPGFDLPTCLVKFAAVNTLYGANVYAAVRMAKHIHHMRLSNTDSLGPDFVDRLSELPVEDPDEKFRRFTSFASKFAHFFVRPEKFPILDSFVEMSLKHHLGKGYSYQPGERYQRFCERIERLRECNGLKEVPLRSLDGYLWVEGLWLTWCKNKHKDKKATINSEIEQLFLEGHYKDGC